MNHGPLKVLHTDDGLPVPFYVIPFDAAGSCTGPETLDDLVKRAADATDVFMFAHGWNDDWTDAIARYEALIGRYADARHRWWNPVTRPYRPVLAGVIWPSTALVFGRERAPDLAGADGSDVTGAVDILADAVRAPARLRELAAQDTLDETGLRELADLLAPALTGDDELNATPPTPDDLLAVWHRLADAEPGDAPPAPRPAGFGFPDPRDVVRVATVLLMKDRAGRVGARGAAVMLRRLIEASSGSRVHLIGHSYGAKVMLSALAVGPPPVRDVESVLLLQPAISCLCFATDADGHGRPGGYRGALTRTRQPVISTYSAHDVPLTRLFQWAVRRPSDLGEARVAGEPGPPSRYAALGGYGPFGTRTGEVAWVDALDPGRRYAVAAGGPRVLAVRGDRVISGHGDVTNPATAWALLCQVMG